MSASGDNDWKWSAEQSDYYRYTYNRDGTWGRVEWGRSRLPDPDSPPVTRPQPATQPPQTQPRPPQPSQPHAYPSHSTTSTTTQPYTFAPSQPAAAAAESAPGLPQRSVYSQYGSQHQYSQPAYTPTAHTQAPQQPYLYPTTQGSAGTYTLGDSTAPPATPNNNPQNSTYPNPNPSSWRTAP